MPQTVKIGPITYKVYRAKKVTRRDGQSLDGQIDYGKACITIRKGIDAQVTRLVLWHEIIHGILSNAGMSGQDEQMIEILASGIVDVLTMNSNL